MNWRSEWSFFSSSEMIASKNCLGFDFQFLQRSVDGVLGAVVDVCGRTKIVTSDEKWLEGSVNETALQKILSEVRNVVLATNTWDEVDGVWYWGKWTVAKVGDLGSLPPDGERIVDEGCAPQFVFTANDGRWCLTAPYLHTLGGGIITDDGRQVEYIQLTEERDLIIEDFNAVIRK